MRNLKNIVASITYYRKHNLGLFVFFTISLFILTCLELLALSQHLKLDQLNDTWSAIASYLPEPVNFQSLTASDQTLQENYRFALKIAVVVISLGLIALTGTLLYLRRQDIKSLLSLGLSKSQIMFQLIVETLFPIVVSFVVLICLVLLFQTSFRNRLVALNDHFFQESLTTVVQEHNPKNEARPKVQGPLPLKAGLQKVVLPYNSQSLYVIDSTQSDLNFSLIRKTAAQSFLKLAALAFILISSVTCFAVLTLSYRMNF